MKPNCPYDKESLKYHHVEGTTIVLKCPQCLRMFQRNPTTFKIEEYRVQPPPP